MKRLIYFMLGLLCWTPVVFAGRVCLEKSTGKLLEYQSFATPGTLTANAISAGYSADQVEEKEVTETEWKVIRQNQLVKPAQDALEAKETDRQQKQQAIIEKLGLTDKDFQDLKEALQ